MIYRRTTSNNPLPTGATGSGRARAAPLRAGPRGDARDRGQASLPLQQSQSTNRTRDQPQWRRGDLVIWDNRCTMHKANADYADGERRLMQCVAGDRPV